MRCPALIHSLSPAGSGKQWKPKCCGPEPIGTHQSGLLNAMRVDDSFRATEPKRVQNLTM